MPSLAKITDGNKTDAQNTSCQSPWKLKFPCINSTWCQKCHRLFTEAVISSVLWILCTAMLKKSSVWILSHISKHSSWLLGRGRTQDYNSNKSLVLTLSLEPKPDQICKELFWDWIFSALLINHSPSWIYFMLQKDAAVGFLPGRHQQMDHRGRTHHCANNALIPILGKDWKYLLTLKDLLSPGNQEKCGK